MLPRRLRAAGAIRRDTSPRCTAEIARLYLLTRVPQGLLDHTAEWRAVDVTAPDAPIVHGRCAHACTLTLSALLSPIAFDLVRCAYAELEAFQPTEMSGEMLRRCSLLAAEEKPTKAPARKSAIKSANRSPGRAERPSKSPTRASKSPRGKSPPSRTAKSPRRASGVSVT